MTDLIENHGARFVERTQERMVFSIGPNHQTDKVVFDEEIRNFITDSVQGHRGTMPTEQHRIAIYRIYSRRHLSFNYDGQTTVGAINLMDQHRREIARRLWLGERSTNGDAQLGCHACDKHPGEEIQDVYEMEVIRDMPNHGERRNQEHKRVRRAWEMFYQWVYKAWHKHGGASRK